MKILDIDIDRKERLLTIKESLEFDELLDPNIDLPEQAGVAPINRWGPSTGRGGLDWFWLRLSAIKPNSEFVSDNHSIRDGIEKARFIESWVPYVEQSRRMLKYATLNQYILKAVRAKMFETKLSTNSVTLHRNNKLDELKDTILSDYYSFNHTGRKNKMPTLTSDSEFSN